VISSVIASVTNAGSVEINGYSEGSGVGVGAGGFGLGGKKIGASLPPQPTMMVANRAINKKCNFFICVDVIC
jgi:hypothetical protein